MTDLLAARYGSLEIVTGMDVSEAVGFIDFAAEREFENRVWQHWLSLGILGQAEISYSNLLARARGNTEIKSDAQILSDVENILDAFERGRKQ